MWIVNDMPNLSFLHSKILSDVLFALALAEWSYFRRYTFYLTAVHHVITTYYVTNLCLCMCGLTYATFYALLRESRTFAHFNFVLSRELLWWLDCLCNVCICQSSASVRHRPTCSCFPSITRKPSWRKGKRATAVCVWRPLAKKSKLIDATNRHSAADKRLPVDG